MALCLVSLAVAFSGDTEFREQPDGTIEKWEKVETIDAGEIYRDINFWESEKINFQKDKQQFITSCVQDCQERCNGFYDNEIELLQMKIDELTEKLKQYE